MRIQSKIKFDFQMQREKNINIKQKEHKKLEILWIERGGEVVKW